MKTTDQGQMELRVKVAGLCGIPMTVTLWRFTYSASALPIVCGGWWSRLDAIEEMKKLGEQGFSTSGEPESYETANPDLPDYPNDLNACHEFERALKPIQRFEYANALETALDLIPEGQGLGLREHRNFAYAHATAEQRCRAFVKTMEGK